MRNTICLRDRAKLGILLSFKFSIGWFLASGWNQSTKTERRWIGQRRKKKGSQKLMVVNYFTVSVITWFLFINSVLMILRFHGPRVELLTQSKICNCAREARQTRTVRSCLKSIVPELKTNSEGIPDDYFNTVCIVLGGSGSHSNPRQLIPPSLYLWSPLFHLLWAWDWHKIAALHDIWHSTSAAYEK